MTARLIGAGMLGWSDLDGRHGPGPVRGAALAPVLAGITGRTLVAGPHDPDLVAELRPTMLVRGRSDAEALAGRFDVVCGGPADLAAEGTWDTVVALDGLDRLTSAEDTPPAWAATFAQVVAAVRPGGTLLLGHENLVGLHRLTAAPPALTDSDWTPATAGDETRPAGLAEMNARLRAAGLTITRSYASFPGPVDPVAVLDHHDLSDETRRALLEATLSRAWSGTGEVLSDPARLTVAALRHGLAADLAPGWIFVAQRSGPAGTHYAGAAGDRTLESLLLRAASARDLPGLRALLVAWQSGPVAAVVAGQVIVSPDGHQHAVAAPGTPGSALHAFAVTVLSGGFPQPWPAPGSPADLTRTLAAMAGVDLDPATIPADRPRPALADLRIDNDRLTRELTQAKIHNAFLERTIADRDRALRHARVANGPLLAARALRRTARRLLRR